MEKEYPPSETKRAALRAEGIYPWSPDFLSLAVVLGIFAAGAAVLAWKLPRLTTFTRIVFTSSTLGFGSPESSFAGLLRGVQWLNQTSLLFFSLAAFVTLLGALFQNRFLFRLKRARTAQRLLMKSQAPGGGLGCAFRALLKCSMFLAAGSFGLLLSLELAAGAEWISVWNGDIANLSSPEHTAALPPFAAAVLKAASARFLLFCLLFFVVIGIVARILAGAQFRSRFGMTREELAAEAKETEIRPEIKAAQRELSSPDREHS